MTHHRLLPLLFITALLGCTSDAPTSGTSNITTPPATETAKAPAGVRPAHWSYAGDKGPSAWSGLSPVYALCGDGKHQSPIALSSGTMKNGTTWAFNYGTSSLRVAHNEHVDELIDNGHTIQVSVDEGSTLSLNGKEYALKQFHFHTPSEHTLDGKNLPMEMHLVHQDAAGDLAVVGVLVQEGAANENFAKLVANLPAAKGDTMHVADHRLELKMHLPAQERAYHYVGSLTTPPCSENVQWLVLADHISLSKEQIAAFASRIGPNNRPVQGLNDRTIEQVELSGTMQ